MGQASLRKGSLLRIAGFLAVLISVYSIWVALWAHQGEALAPVQLDRDSCAQCGMTISDIRYAISVLAKDEQDHPVTLHFDDPGCFLAYAKAHPQSTWVGAGHDFVSGAQVPLGKLYFEKTNQATPMGTGWITKKEKKGLNLTEALSQMSLER